MIQHLPDYSNLDLSGEAKDTAARMEARSQVPASKDMFEFLLGPLLGEGVKTVLDVGCGTAPISRRIKAKRPELKVFACDKSAEMIRVAESLAKTEQLKGLEFKTWDVLNEGAFPFETKTFDLIVSSVMIPYFADEQIRDIVVRLAARLAPGGTLAFMEQDLMTDSLNYPDDLVKKIFAKEQRATRSTLSLGLRNTLREAGLEILPNRSYLWTEAQYGAYVRDLLGRFLKANLANGSMTQQEVEKANQTLEIRATEGDFFYSLNYHLIAGRKRI